MTTGQTAGLTLAVQIGFVVGAVASAMSGLADAIPSRRLFAMAAIAGAAANASLVLLPESAYSLAFALRLATGITLAAVYPSGLKAMAGWFHHGRGMALGVLVGALSVGSALPHLIRGFGVEWEGVVLSASVLALVGAFTMSKWVEDGPYETAPQKFSPALVGRAIRDKGVRLSTYGYLGHMWELYAMWTWTAGFLAASATRSGSSGGWVSTATFSIIAVGGVGSWLAGRWADRIGRTVVAGAAMAISGTCALLTPVVFGTAAWIVVPLFLIWGITVVADSAQFSTMVTEIAGEEMRGTALTLQTAVGFLLTLVTIRTVPQIAETLTWRWAFPLLAAGPLLGVMAMLRLKRSQMAGQLAGGKG